MAYGLFLLAALTSCARVEPPSLQLFNPLTGQINTFGISQTPRVDSAYVADNYTAYMVQKSRSRIRFMNTGMPLKGTPVNQLPPFGVSRKLTYFSYEALDNSLYGDLERMLDTLEDVAGHPDMHLLAQTDSIGSQNTARYYLKNDSQPVIVSPYQTLPDQWENSGHSQTLLNGLKWAMTEYPSQLFWFNVSTHGLGFSGLNYDETPQTSMTIMNFAQTLRQGLPRRPDVLSFDACLMASVEVASEIQDVAHIMVASEDSTLYWGDGYKATLQQMRDNKLPMQAKDIAVSLVSHVASQGAALTISAIDLTKMKSVESAMNQLAKALRAAIPRYRNEIITAMREAKSFEQALDVPYRDINRLSVQLQRRVPEPTIQAAFNRLNQVLYRDKAILSFKQTQAENGQGRGMSVYLPVNEKVSQLYRQTHFAQVTEWDEFLMEINATSN